MCDIKDLYARWVEPTISHGEMVTFARHVNRFQLYMIGLPCTVIWIKRP